MRYKALLTGNNKMVINEFFTYMDFSFECMTTSDRYDDIMSHIKYVKPDLFVYCLYGEKPDDIKRFANMERKFTEEWIPIVIIGDADECDQFEKLAPMLEATIIQRPISSQNIEKKILNMMEEHMIQLKRREKQREEEKAKESEESVQDVLQAARNMLAEVNAEEKVKKRKHILVVDDDSSVLKLIKGYLSERYDVATAINGKVAMKFLETKGTDLVLLDYEMPEENGPAVLAKIRKNDAIKDLPVVFLTGVTDKNKIREVLTMKPQGYLLKPIDMERLSSTIKGILG